MSAPERRHSRGGENVPQGPRRGRLLVLALALAVAGSALPAAAACPPPKPTLTAPSSVRPGQSYSVSWTDVFAGRPGAGEYYSVERSSSPAFSVVERFKSTGSALSLPAAPSGSVLLYHRVVVQTMCPPSAGASVASTTVVVRISNECATPTPLGEVSVSAENPPAYSAYVVSWDTGGCSQPGPGGCNTLLTYRLRRTTPHGRQEMATSLDSATFADPPGEYVYEVRGEDPCGSAGPWSLPRRVVVGEVRSALALVVEPKPLLAVAPSSFASTSLVIRNTGTAPVAVVPEAGASSFRMDVPPFVLGPNETREVEVTLATIAPMEKPAHAVLEFRTGIGGLFVPVDGTVAAAPAAASVTWAGGPAEVDSAARSVERTLTNPGDTVAAVVSSTRPTWVTVESTDGRAWDRPLAPRESRTVRLVVDRARRRSSTGTEVGFVSVETAGFPGKPDVLTVLDDGPDLPLADPVRPSAASVRSRILYASMPNARDATGEGQYTSDLWLANLDATAPIDVTLFFTPIAGSGAPAGARRADIRLSAGESRRFRNVVGKIPGFEGACALEVSSPSATLAATALVGNSPVDAAAAAKRGLLAVGGTGTASGTPQYGFEMRPTAPGEGVQFGEPPYILSGLRHDARRRTNVLLTETAGYPTTVRLKVLDRLGGAIQRDGQAVMIEREVPALGTIQINDEELFGAENLTGSPYATVEFVRGVLDPFWGKERGAVVPFATVIDRGTQDASLRVGVSTKNLDPVPPASVAAPTGAYSTLSSLPFGGGPAPLLFPVAHTTGAPLAGGERPRWRTRVSLTNASETDERRLRLRFLDQSGARRTGSLVVLSPRASVTFEDVVEENFEDVTPTDQVYGSFAIENQKNPDGTTWFETWADVDVQTETYTPDPATSTLGDFKTGMEAYSYRHGYTSFQSNLGTVQIEGAETSASYRTNLILEEVGGAACQLAISAYLPGSLTPIATASRTLPPFGYVSDDLFRSILGLQLASATDVRVVVRQVDGEGVFVAFASKINLATGDPANIFLRPASAGTGR